MERETRRDARARIEREIMDAARSQLAEVGAANLSLREVAREIGMVSSAVYRYVESRDELLTRLIIEAYEQLGTTAERARDAARSTTRDHDLDVWVATARAIRSWAVSHPHQYLLLYGTPVPGYAAPDDTVGPGTRVTFALVGIVAAADGAGRLNPATATGQQLDRSLVADLERLAGDVAVRADADTVLAVLAAWTQMFGLISFELTSQTRGVVTHHAELFDASVRRLGHHIGLR